METPLDVKINQTGDGSKTEMLGTNATTDSAYRETLLLRGASGLINPSFHTVEQEEENESQSRCLLAQSF